MEPENKDDILVKAEHLSKFFQISKKAVLKAVDDVSFDIKRGETVGLVGESGCGKSTVGRCLIQLYTPDQGKIIYDGKEIKGLTSAERLSFCKKVQMIFQNPYSSLNPRMTVSEIISEGIRIHEKLSEQEKKEYVEELLLKVGLNKEHMSRFPHEFSGGQRQRIGIARALSVKPEFIICDEPISALDVSIQAQVINMLKKFQKEEGLTYLFIAHDLSVVKYISDRIIVMYLGKIVEMGGAQEIYKNPMHPYTQSLLSAIPEADPKEAKSKKRIILEGEIPSPINPKPCCRFAKRCRFAAKECFETEPVLREVSPGHKAACLMLDKTISDM